MKYYMEFLNWFFSQESLGAFLIVASLIGVELSITLIVIAVVLCFARR